MPRITWLPAARAATWRTASRSGGSICSPLTPSLPKGRTSRHKCWPNQFRLLLSSLAYTLIETIRRIGLKGTEMARAQAGTIRLKLLKIGAVILRNSRRVRFHLSTACPDKALFMMAAERLDPG